MRHPAIFFDRDNTLIASDGFLGEPAKVQLVAGAADAIARARSLGFAIVTISNQSGVARGLFSEDDVHAVNARLDHLLRSQNEHAKIDRHEFCPDHPDAKEEKYRRQSDRRKPAPGMIHCAAQAMQLDLPASWVIGDAARDVEAGHAAGCRTILFRDPNLPPSPAADEAPKVKPDFICSTLSEAIDIIARSASPKSRSPAAPAKLDSVAEQILYELRRRNEPITDFSVTKLLAGIAQIISVAVVFLAYLYRDDHFAFGGMVLFAIWLQTVTIALLIMGRQT